MDRFSLKRVTEGKNAFRKLKTFHEDHIALYTTNICQNKMSKIRIKTLEREKVILDHYSNLSSLQKTDQIANLEYFCIQMGCHTSTLDAEYFGKVPSPTLKEIQDFAYNESCLSISDILNKP